ncbi:MAG: polyisoprenoid-binding protein YceI [Flavobacteriaceae bacterium]|jgi:polyisoprenoid-binding protein YceI
MDILELISFLLLTIVSVVSFAFKRDSLTGILHLLLFASIALLIKNDLSEDQLATQITYGLIGVVALNLVLSKWTAYQKKYLRVVPPILTFIAFWIFLGKGELTYLDSSFDLSSNAIIMLPFIGVLAFEIAYAKSEVIKSMFSTDDSLIKIILTLMAGVGILIGAFNALGFGVLLISSGYLAASFYRTKGSKQLIYSLLAVSLVWMFASHADGIATDLQVGKTLLGLFFGVFAVGVIQFSWSAKKRKKLLVLISYLLGISFIIGALLMQLQHNSFGGMEAFVGALVGFAIANALIGKRIVGMSILCLIIGVGIYFPPFLINEEQQAIEKELEVFSKSETEEEVKIATLPLSDVTGKYKIDEESSLISFKLGPEGGVTKGAIRKFSGTVEIKEDVVESSFSIEMPLSTLTTFNAMRDDALMAPEYFDGDNFDKMTFSANTLKETNEENEFDLTGQFTLLGVSKELTVRIMRLDDKSGIFLVGKGALDRTLFGMAPDTRQGNEVSFEFKVELVK